MKIILLSVDTLATYPQDSSSNLYSNVIVAGVTVVFTFLITYVFSRRDNKGKDRRAIKTLEKQLQIEEEKVAAETAKSLALVQELDQIKGEMSDLQVSANKYDVVKKKLQESTVIRTYELPVILLGPRQIGKSSLLMQLHTPWKNETSIQSTSRHRYATLPIHQFMNDDMEPHFADPDIRVKAQTNLCLKIYDFPGELSYQKAVKDIIISETNCLKQSTGKDLGVAIILMFDAEEVINGVSKSTIEYYNGELFRELRTLVSVGKVDIDRVIIVFNKYDKLKSKNQNKKDAELLENCLEVFSTIFSALRGFCNQEKVCEILTIFDRENTHLNNMGATIIVGEVARRFVSVFDSKKAVEYLETASNNASKYF